MQILDAALYQYTLPLAWPLPLKKTRLEHRQGLIVALKLQTRKKEGWVYGEAAPLPDFSRETLDQAQQQLVQQLTGWQTSGKLPDSINKQDDIHPSVAFALESLLWQGQQFYQGAVLNADDITLPVVPLLSGSTESMLDRLSHWRGHRPAEFKLKVARTGVEDDVYRIRQLLAILPETVRLRLDANRRWTLTEACDFAARIPQHRVTYIEEPVSPWDDCAAFYQLTGVPFAWDETLQNPDFQFHNEAGLGALVIKPTLVGGLQRCKYFITHAHEHGIRVVISSSFESVLGVNLLKLLSHYWAPGEAAGLDTLSAFKQPLYTHAVPVGMALPDGVIEQMELVWR